MEDGELAKKLNVGLEQTQKSIVNYEKVIAKSEFDKSMVDINLLKKGIEELLNYRIKRVIGEDMYISTERSIKEYQDALALAKEFNIDTSKYNKIVEEYYGGILI